MIHTTRGTMPAESLVDLLNYLSYRAQREIHGMSAANAKRLWQQTGDALEAQYQAELAIEKASAV